MDAILAILQRWDLHPVVDHFTVSLLVVGVLIDLIASLAPTRTWLRYTALTLMILGAIAAGASYFTGDMEGDRLLDLFGKAIGPDAKAVFERHATLGTYMAVVFGVLALWRLLIEAIGFFAGSRPVYLFAAVVASVILLYIGSLGGELVYRFGWGTALMQAPTATPTANPIANEALPTVSVPTATSAMTPAPSITAVPPKVAEPTATPSPPPTH
jgi:uncharacterized membrane protein